MKKSLAKKITLSILAGAMFVGSSIAYAGGDAAVEVGSVGQGIKALAIGASYAGANGSIAIGSATGNPLGASQVTGNAPNGIVIGAGSQVTMAGSVALGSNTTVQGEYSVALGYGSYAEDSNVVSIGRGSKAGEGPATRKIINVTDGSIAKDSHDAVTGGQLYAVSNKVDNIDQTLQNNYYNKETTEAYVNHIKDGIIDITGNANYMFTKYVKSGDNLTSAVQKLDLQIQANEDAIAEKANAADVYTKAQADSTFVKISNNANDTPQEGFVIVKADNNTKVSVTGVGTYNSVVIDAKKGITVGDNSTCMDSTGFYAGGAKPHNYQNSMAAITEEGKIKGAGGKFEVDTDGSVKAANGNFTVDEDGNVTAANLYTMTQVDSKLNEKANASEVYKKTETYSQAEVNSKLDEKANASEVYKKTETYTKAEVDSMIGGSSDAINGINQRLDKTNAKINKVGAGAAALAALHPLEYDPDDKLTFSAGMGNYAGENAAALGAFYRPNEKFMVSLGGTMGNGENMVNLGLSIGLDKPNGFAKMSKRELIQEVNAVKAENNMLVQKVDAVEAENEAIKAEMAEMKALLQKIMAKK